MTSSLARSASQGLPRHAVAQWADRCERRNGSEHLDGLVLEGVQEIDDPFRTPDGEGLDRFGHDRGGAARHCVAQKLDRAVEAVRQMGVPLDQPWDDHLAARVDDGGPGPDRFRNRSPHVDDPLPLDEDDRTFQPLARVDVEERAVADGHVSLFCPQRDVHQASGPVHAFHAEESTPLHRDSPTL